MSQKIFTLEDIDTNWKKHIMERLFESEELLTFQKTAYSASIVYNKTHFNRTIQENLINKNNFSFSETTKSNMNKILTFLKDKLNDSNI